MERLGARAGRQAEKRARAAALDSAPDSAPPLQQRRTALPDPAGRAIWPRMAKRQPHTGIQNRTEPATPPKAKAMPRRLIVAALPYLAAEHALRREGLTGLVEPFALIEAQGSARRVVSTNARAAELGLMAGIGLADARALVPGLVTRTAAPERLRVFWRALERWAGRFSPIVGRDRGLTPMPRLQAGSAQTTPRPTPRPGDSRRARAPKPNAAAGPEGGALVIDASGAAHLFGGEAAMVTAVVDGLAELGLTARAAMADTRGAAWAVAHFTDDAVRVVPPGATRRALETLPPRALRLDAKTVEGLEAVGLTRLGDMAGLPRGQLARRFGLETVRRLDQALGLEPEPVAPARAAPHFATRLTLAEPIGLTSDVTAGLERLLESLCARLEAAEQGARALRLSVRRVDGADQSVAITLARPMRDPMRLRALFAPKIDELDAGFGIDALRLAATATEPMAPVQSSGQAVGGARVQASVQARMQADGGSAGQAVGPSGGRARAVAGASAPSAAHAEAGESARLADLMSRIGNRIGFENLQRLVPAESHIPERAFSIAAAGFSEPGDWRAAGAVATPALATPAVGTGLPRPLVLFAPEPVLQAPGPEAITPRAAEPGWPPDAAGPTRSTTGSQAGSLAPSPAGGLQVPPPKRFRWRGRVLRLACAEGPERIAPEWWWDDPAWRSGPRDYWRVACHEGPRLWLFHTPAAPLPAWSVHGIFA
ncbi:MAG: DNA polymerase Y family protein [Pseudomonadota bacterium]